MARNEYRDAPSRRASDEEEPDWTKPLLYRFRRRRRKMAVSLISWVAPNRKRNQAALTSGVEKNAAAESAPVSVQESAPEI